MVPAVITFGLLSAITWGAGDFTGGFASKKHSEFTVVVISQIISGILLVPTAILFGEPFPILVDVLWGMGGGIFGAIGLLAFYRAMADGQMGLVAPLTAMVTAIIPVLFGIFIDGFPPWLTGVGILVALLAVWLISGGDGEAKITPQSLWLPFIGGLGFSLFFVALDRITPGSVFWPLAGARVASVTVLGSIGLFRGVLKIPTLRDLPLIGLAGVLDTCGNAFFALAAQAGRIDIAAVLSSLYPASSMLLARYILQERLSFQQLIGVAVALFAIILIAL